jgi:S1-C subfamily serine protease
MRLFAPLFPAFLLFPILLFSPAPDQSAFVRIDVGVGHGSGTHLGNGYILTAAHVAYAAEGAMVSTRDGQVMPAELVWSDQSLDVAIIKVSKPILARSIPVDCAVPDVGIEVRAYGNPLDQGPAISTGHVAREPRKSDQWASAILADLTAAPGMSGGGVIHKGKLVGVLVGGMIVSTGMSASIVGFTFVVPTSAFCDQLKEHVRKEGV